MRITIKHKHKNLYNDKKNNNNNQSVLCISFYIHINKQIELIFKAKPNWGITFFFISEHFMGFIGKRCLEVSGWKKRCFNKIPSFYWACAWISRFLRILSDCCLFEWDPCHWNLMLKMAVQINLMRNASSNTDIFAFTSSAVFILAQTQAFYLIFGTKLLQMVSSSSTLTWI